jgi:uncharacterized repeat protein (TIGR01451 family)
MVVSACSLYAAVLLVGLGVPPIQIGAQVAQAPQGLQPAVARPQPSSLGGHPEADKPPTAPASPPPAQAAGQTASVQVEKIGPASINVGQQLVYELVVRNVGPVSVSQVRVEDQLPAAAKFVKAEPSAEVRLGHLSWDLGSLEPNAERRIKVEIKPESEGDLETSATVTAAVACSARTKITRPRLTITKSGPESVHLDDPAVFQLQITNTGTGPATGVILHDVLPAGLKHPQGEVIEADLGTLAPNETRSLKLETIAVQIGRQVNEAIVSGDGGIQATAKAVVLVTQSQLQFRKDGPKQRFLNREAEYDFEVFNPGSASASNVRVIDTLPEGLDFVSASDGGAYDAATRQVQWTLGLLPAGQRRGLTLKVLARVVGDWVNRAVAQADRGLEVKAETAIHIEGVAALMLEVVDLDDPVEVGAETSYEIRVVNQGTAACTGLQIVATVPGEMMPLDAEGPSSHRIQGQQVIFAPLPKLASHADVLYRVKVKGIKPGDVRFTVQMSCDQLQRPVCEQESTRVYADSE